MKKLNILFILGLVTFFFACEEEGDKVIFPESPVLPVLSSMPDLNLARDNGSDTVTFTGTEIDPGFQASANYYLEASPAGTNFEETALIYTGITIDEVKITVNELNEKLLKAFPEDQTSSADFRIRSVLVVDAGTGAPGSSSAPMEFSSETVTSNITIYGLLRLDLINSGKDQKIVSPASDGVYASNVWLDNTMAFTLYNPETDVTYGATGTDLVVNGDPIPVTDNGWNRLIVDLNEETISLERFSIALVGSATPGGWGDPDLDMDYDIKSDSWSITTDLAVGEFKFRKNDDWGWNLGGTENNLVHGGDNIPIEKAGNYTIVLTTNHAAPDNETGIYTIKLNN